MHDLNHDSFTIKLPLTVSLQSVWTSVERQGAKRFNSRRTASGFYNLEHHKPGGDQTIHSWNWYILWKMNCTTTVQTADVPFNFVICQTSVRGMDHDSKIQPPPISHSHEIIAIPKTVQLTWKKGKFKWCTNRLFHAISDFCHVYKCIVSHRLSVTRAFHFKHILG